MTIQTTKPRSRRALLAGAAAGAAALAADRLARPLPALAEDNYPVILGADNTSTEVTSITGGGLRVEGGKPSFLFALVAHGVSDGHGILGNSVAEGTVTSDSTPGAGVGVSGDSGSGIGVRGSAPDGTGVEGYSANGVGGSFRTDTGSALMVDGPAFLGPTHVGGDNPNFLFGVDNENTGESGGGILANSRGGKPTIEGDAFPSDFFPGAGIQGVSYTGTSYEDGAFGEGPGIGVQGLSGDGNAVEGRSRRAAGVVGFAGEPEPPPPYGEPGLSYVGVLGFGPMGEDPWGYGAVGVGHVGVHGFGGVFGVEGRSASGFGGNFVTEGPPDVAAVRAWAPGDTPAIRAISGIEQEGGEDGGLALDVVGKARFSTAGEATVPQGQNSVFVLNASVTPNSHISITLISDPGPRQLRWLSRSGGSGFTVYFAGGPPGQRPATDFTYLIVEPPA